MTGNCWSPWHEGPRERPVQGDDGWVTILSVVLASGPRSIRHTITRDTELEDITICRACLEASQGVGLALLVDDPAQRVISETEGEFGLDRCTVSCLGKHNHRSFLMRAMHRQGKAYCPGCGGKLRVESYDGPIRERWRDVFRRSWYEGTDLWITRAENRERGSFTIPRPSITQGIRRIPGLISRGGESAEQG